MKNLVRYEAVLNGFVIGKSTTRGDKELARINIIVDLHNGEEENYNNYFDWKANGYPMTERDV